MRFEICKLLYNKSVIIPSVQRTHRSIYFACICVIYINRTHVTYHIHRYIYMHKSTAYWPVCRSLNSKHTECNKIVIITSKRHFYVINIFSLRIIPDKKVHGANIGPIWGRQDPGGPHVGPINLAIWEVAFRHNEWIRIDPIPMPSVLLCLPDVRRSHWPAITQGHFFILHE